MPCVYILKSKVRDKFYIGSSREDNASVRLKAHNAGKSRSTKSSRPWFVVQEEQCETYTEARQREIFLKSGVGRKLVRESFGSLERKGGRAVECTGLENRQGRKSLVSSNLTPSAILPSLAAKGGCRRLWLRRRTLMQEQEAICS